MLCLIRRKFEEKYKRKEKSEWKYKIGYWLINLKSINYLHILL